MMLHLEDEEEIQSGQPLGVLNEGNNKVDNHHFPLNFMKRLNGVGTIRSTLQVGRIRLQILVDGGNLIISYNLASLKC